MNIKYKNRISYRLKRLLIKYILVFDKAKNIYVLVCIYFIYKIFNIQY